VVRARPATETDALEFAGARSLLRKALLWQVRKFPSEVIETDDGHALALVMMQWHRKTRVEVSIHFRPLAQSHMLALIHLAQLTLQRLGQDGVMAVVRVRESNWAAQRMAGLSGFRPVGLKDGQIWISKRGQRDGANVHRTVWQQGPGKAATADARTAER